MTPTTRYLCPLDCGWHHDSRDLPDLAGLSGNTIEEIIRAGIERNIQADETAVREHLETHPLIDWVTEVARLQQELNAAASKGTAEGSSACELRITVTAPTPADAERWTRGIRDMVTAEFGDSMRLDITEKPLRKAPLAVQQQVAERFGFPLRTPAMGGEQQ